MVVKPAFAAGQLSPLQSSPLVQQRPWGVPTVTSSLERCAGQLLYHQSGKLCWRRRRHRALLTPFITGTATATPSLSRADARVTLRLLQSPCALCSGSFAAKYPLRALEASRGGAVLASPQGREPCSGAASGGTPLQAFAAPSSPLEGLFPSGVSPSALLGP